MLGPESEPRFYVYSSQDARAALFEGLIKRYATEAARLYDVKSLAVKLDMDAGELLIILLHETAYRVFESLDRSGALKFPDVLKTGRPVSEAVRLFSLEMGDSPRWREEVDYLRMKNQGTADGRVVDTLKETLAQDPRNLDAAWLLGFAYYEVGDYRTALEAFRAFSLATAAETDIRRVREHD